MNTFGDLFLIDSATMSDITSIAPMFIVMGLVCIGAYLAPVILGKLDDWKNKEEIEIQDI